MQQEPPDEIPTSLLLKELEAMPALKHGGHSPAFPGVALSPSAPRSGHSWGILHWGGGCSHQLRPPSSLLVCQQLLKV